MEEGELQDIVPKIGVKLYKTILSDLPAYTDLIEGCSYNNDTAIHRGLGVATAYFVYARWIKDMAIQSTNFGMVVKTTEFSLPASPQQLRIAEESSRESGIEALNGVLIYMQFIGLLTSSLGERVKTTFIDILALGD